MASTGLAGHLVPVGVAVEPPGPACSPRCDAGAWRCSSPRGGAMSGAIPIDLAFTLEQDGFVLEIDHHAESRVLALFGPSGSGKTTCLEAIAGLRAPSQGRIAIAGRDLYSSHTGLDLPPRLRGVGYVPQDALLFPHLDVRGNLLFGARRSRPGHGNHFALEDVLTIVEAGSLLNRRVSALSGGERQRVALARA